VGRWKTVFVGTKILFGFGFAILAATLGQQFS